MHLGLMDTATTIQTIHETRMKATCPLGTFEQI